MNITPIQFFERDSDAVRLQRLNRLSEQIAQVARLLSPSPPVTTGGSTWITGSGPPGASVGTKGDFYLDSLTGDYYEKLS